MIKTKSSSIERLLIISIISFVIAGIVSCKNDKNEALGDMAIGYITGTQSASNPATTVQEPSPIKLNITVSYLNMYGTTVPLLNTGVYTYSIYTNDTLTYCSPNYCLSQIFTIVNATGAPINPSVTAQGSSKITVTTQPGSPVPAGQSTTFVLEYNTAVWIGENEQAAVAIVTDDPADGIFTFTAVGNGYQT